MQRFGACVPRAAVAAAFPATTTSTPTPTPPCHPPLPQSDRYLTHMFAPEKHLKKEKKKTIPIALPASTAATQNQPDQRTPAAMLALTHTHIYIYLRAPLGGGFISFATSLSGQALLLCAGSLPSPGHRHGKPLVALTKRNTQARTEENITKRTQAGPRHVTPCYPPTFGRITRHGRPRRGCMTRARGGGKGEIGYDTAADNAQHTAWSEVICHPSDFPMIRKCAHTEHRENTTTTATTTSTTTTTTTTNPTRSHLSSRRARDNGSKPPPSPRHHSSSVGQEVLQPVKTSRRPLRHPFPSTPNASLALNVDSDVTVGVAGSRCAASSAPICQLLCRRPGDQNTRRDKLRE